MHGDGGTRTVDWTRLVGEWGHNNEPRMVGEGWQ